MKVITKILILLRILFIQTVFVIIFLILKLTAFRFYGVTKLFIRSSVLYQNFIDKQQIFKKLVEFKKIIKILREDVP